MSIPKITVTADEYIEGIGFSIYTYLTGKIVKRDLYKGGAERSLGEYTEHLIRGKLAEIAFKKFLARKFGITTLTEMDLPIFIPGNYLPDILAFRRKRNDWTIPCFWIDVKAVVENQKWMLIRASSFRGGKRRKPRPYCAYVNAMVHLPKDHLGRLIKYAPTIKGKINRRWVKRLTDLREVQVDILGFTLYADMINILKSRRNRSIASNLDRTFGANKWGFFKEGTILLDPDTGKKTVKLGSDNCAIALARVRKSKQLKTLVNLLIKDKPLAKKRPSKVQAGFKKEMLKALVLFREQKTKSWFERALDAD